MTALEESDAQAEAAVSGRPFVVITVHGTFAGVANVPHPFWWQDTSQLCIDIQQRKPGAMLRFESFRWHDDEKRPGPNRESERRRWSQQLLQHLRKLEDDGTPYHLIGHSHGGSVIWHALRLSAANGRRLDRLQSWCTIGTPFLEFGPDRSAWWRMAAAATVIGALIWGGIPGSLWSLAANAFSLGVAKAAAAVPLLNEFADIRAGLGDATFYAALGGIAAAVFAYLAILVLPVRDLFRRLAAYANRSQGKVAAGWYEKSWLGIVHKQDEAVAGLKATLIRPPDLVLRQGRGWQKYVRRIFDPVAAAVDQFAWGVLIKNAQGTDLPATALRSVGTAPPGFERGPIVLPDDVASEIVARADTAAAGVLARVRQRLESAADKEDLEALTGILNGTYDRDSLIHTTMFESAEIRSIVLANMFSPRQTTVESPSIRQGRPWFALPLAKVAVAVGFVAMLGALTLVAYQSVIYPQTNSAQAERILTRFDDPSFQSIGGSPIPGSALVRAYRLGAPLEKVFIAAEKLSDDQSEAYAYQAIIREMALTGRLDEIAGWLGPPSNTPTRSMPPKYRHSDHLPLVLAVALEELVQSGTQPTLAMARLYDYAAAPTSRAPGNKVQTDLFRRLIPVAIALRTDVYLSEWLQQIGAADRTCNDWTKMVENAAPLVREAAQLRILETVIQGCKSTTASLTEDKQRLLRRLAVGAMPSCRIAETMLARASVNQTGPDAPIPPRFIDCLVAAGRQSDAADLAAKGRARTNAPVELSDIRRRFALAETLARAPFPEESRKWAEFALAGANEFEKGIAETNISLELDALKLSILKFLHHDRWQAFVEELRKGDAEFKDSLQLPAIRKKLRSLHLGQLERAESNSCETGTFTSNFANAILGILKSYPGNEVAPLAMSVAQIANICKANLSRDTLNGILTVASANDDSAKRAADIGKLAPYATTLRAGLQLADTAAIPVFILDGYVRSVDRLRPALRPKFERDFVPVQYVKPSSGIPEPVPPNK